MPSPLHLYPMVFACFLGGHLLILGAVTVLHRAFTGAAPRLRADARGLRYLLEFVGAEALMLTAALQLGVVRLAPFSAPRTLATLALGFVWWEFWFYFGHRLLHTRWLYPLHRPHHATPGVHPSLAFGALETVALSSGFYLPLALASHRFHAVSVETLALVFSLAYALNVVSHLDAARLAPRLAATPWRHLLGSPRRHAQHHAGRRGNYGLNSPWPDRLFGTALDAPGSVPR
ncbi:MAG: sterol desaturase family protein [Deltaproteobacteria bacterium]|nr:sterol desaturase family protein [Myxococcales bacterium]MDP3214294.1 sterol desaturase family protein [Deltaproteobacteria bacterium]